MLISTKGRYALRLVIDVALNSAEGPVSIREISERQDMPLKYLEQLTRSLVRAGLLNSTRGQHGGYSLARPAEQITAGQVLQAAEGDLAPIYCLEDGAEECPRAEVCTTLGFWKGLDQVINDYVGKYTVADLCASPVCK
ncbi:MAG: RrF2 family transcriptional regulator [Coriobacteriia bacterium]|nr:RrF2 family transcriptional regulator [Coriobacteriia bacterium]